METHSIELKQLQQDIQRHLDDHLCALAQVIEININENSVALDPMLSDLETLLVLTQTYSPHQATASIYQTVCTCLYRVQTFLQTLNIPLDTYHFQESALGHMWQYAHTWKRHAGMTYGMTEDDLWQLLAPAQPDTLHEISPSRFEARWRKPVPQMDIEIIRGTAWIIITKDAFEPSDRPGSVALQFIVEEYHLVKE